LLSVQEGALFEGRLSTLPESVREDRKVMVLAKEELVPQTAEGQ